jgi:TonB family protein
MKQLLLFLLFFAVQAQAQTMDCQEFEQLNEPSTEQSKIRPKMGSVIHTTTGTMESVMEIDTGRRVRTVTKSPFSKIETIIINGVVYTKEGKHWDRAEVVPPIKDYSKKTIVNVQKTKSKDCKKVGSEILDGVSCDIIEKTIEMAGAIIKERYWVNFEEKITKKIVIEYGDTKTVREFKEIEPIENPLNETTKKPIFKDGEDNLPEFIKAYLEYPQTAREAKIKGTVQVNFTVAADGTVGDITVKKGIGYGCDEAAIEVVKKTSGNWYPALSEGKPVSSSFTLPVKFKL